jgi:hypothetical protein
MWTLPNVTKYSLLSTAYQDSTASCFTFTATCVSLMMSDSEVNGLRRDHINPLKSSGNFTKRLTKQPIIHFVFVFRIILTLNSDYFLKQPLTG